MARIAALAFFLLVAGILAVIWSQRTVSDPASREPPGQAGAIDVDGGPAATAPDRTAGCRDASAEGGDGWKSLEEFEFVAEQAAAGLRGARDSEHLLVAGLLQQLRDEDSALFLLTRAYQSNPDHPLVVAQLLANCKELLASCTLELGALENQLIFLERSNALTWSRVADSRFERDDVDGSLAALREAAAATIVDSHFADYILLFDRSLAASSGLPSSERLDFAWGFAAQLREPAYDAYELCNLQADYSGEWLDVCTRLGERFASEGRTLLTRALGLSLQKNMYGLTGNTYEQQRIEYLQEAMDAQYEATEARIPSDWGRNEALARRYLEVLSSSDEMAARAFLVAELERVAGPDAAAGAACEGP